MRVANSAESRSFPSTSWTVIRQAQIAPEVERARALDRLVAIYWRPVYWTIRLDWSAAPEDARDLTQEYFARFIEQGLVQDVASDRGSFRSYVKVTLRNFLLSWRRAERAQKRGGGLHIVALDDLDPVEADPPAGDGSPEARFERELMRAILLRALDDLRKSLDREGKVEVFALFHHYYVTESEGRAPDYKELTIRFKIGVHDVKNRLSMARARFRNHVLALLRDGLTSDADLASEIRAVFAS
jgi:RNA polymerase sigma-70 factor (ECF subfamily)